LPRGVSRSRLQRKLRNSPRCHGLAPWSLMLAATKKVAQLSQMPRACPVESHARGYKESCAPLPDATGLPRGVSRLWLERKLRTAPRCHGLAPWSLTLAAIENPHNSPEMPRLAPWSLTLAATKKVAQRSQMPRACPDRGRTASYPTAPAQIPACGFPAPGSSWILASA